MGSYTFPDPQGLVVLNCQLDRGFVHTAKNARKNAGFFQANQKDIIPIGDAADNYSVEAGDILWGHKQESGVQRKSKNQNSSTESQQPWVFASLNGFYCSNAQWNQARGCTDHEKLRDLFFKHNQVYGISIKKHPWLSDNEVQIDQPVAAVAGAFFTLNTGPHNIMPNQFIAVDVPDPHTPPPADTNGKVRFSASRRKLVPIPFDMIPRVSRDSIKNWLESAMESEPQIKAVMEEDGHQVYRTLIRMTTATQAEERAITLQTKLEPLCKVLTKEGCMDCDEKDIFKQLVDFHHNSLMALFEHDDVIGPIVERLVGYSVWSVADSILGNDYYTASIDKLIEQIKAQEMAKRDRIVGKSLRAAARGEYFDMLIGC
jgi:hypothetical protein